MKFFMGGSVAAKIEKNLHLTKRLMGRRVAAEIEEKLHLRVQEVKKTMNRSPLLATIQIGEDSASSTYVEMIAKACKRIDIASRQLVFPDATALTTEAVIKTIQQLNLNADVDGILLQHPVPQHIDERACFEAIDCSKDIDGVTSAGFGKLCMGLPTLTSATPLGIMALLDFHEITIEGKHAVIVGRSPILGRPMAELLLKKNATITLCHSKTANLSEIIHLGDIVIGAVGKPGLIKGEWIKDGAVVIDAGFHPSLNTGDIALDAIKDRCSAYTPVPGGVGPMTIAMLMQQTVIAAEQKNENLPRVTSIFNLGGN